MKRLGISGLCVAAIFTGLIFAPSANASPAAAFDGVAATVSGKGTIEEVRHRRGHWRYGHWRRHRDGWGLGAAAAAGLLLSAPLWAGGYDDGYDSDDYDGDAYAGSYAYGGEGGYARCRASFRSFDPDSGTYMGYDGVRRMCPYL